MWSTSGGPQPRTLLAHLIAHANEAMSTEDLMWPEHPPITAPSTVQTWVSRLRGVLGSDMIESLATGYRLRVEPEAIDAVRFEAKVDQARAAMSLDAERASELLTEATRMWRGRPYEDVADDGSLAPEVRRLDDLRLTVMEERLTADLSLGRHGVLTGEIELLLEEHPYRERLWGLLMTALVRSGRHDDALRANERARRILGEDVAIEPSAELGVLMEQILLKDEAPRPTPESLGLRNPYKGLQAFQESDAADFFGRRRLVDQLVAAVASTRLLAIVGPSGSGKSSVVRAGLIPALRTGRLYHSEKWVIAEMVPGGQPFAELESALLRAHAGPSVSLINQLRDEQLGLTHAVLRLLPSDDSELVLVIDQLEELFTLVQDEQVRRRFLDTLRVTVEAPHRRLRVVAIMRADFFDRPLLYPEFGRMFTSSMQNVMPLTGSELEEAVTGPADRTGLVVEPTLLAQLVTDATAQPGALPRFQYTLRELCNEREGTELTAGIYQKLGGLRGAVAGRADALFASLSTEEQHAARQLFLRLIAIGEHGEVGGKRVAANELEDFDANPAAMQTAIATFAQQRLLIFDGDPRFGIPTTEVSHESLLWEWPRLEEWIQDGRADLRKHLVFSTARTEWVVAEQDPDYLLSGGRLELYEDWATNASLSLTTGERDYVDAAISKRDVDQAATDEVAKLHRRRKPARSRVIAATIAIVIAAAITIGTVVAALN